MSKRINKVIELWEQGQPVYHKHPEELSYEAGINEAKTLADMFLIDFEHNPFDTVGLTKFIEGLNLNVPVHVEGVAPELLTPKETWDNKEAYEDYLKDLVQKFQDNIKKFDIREEIIKAGPGF